jgi:N,N'-diacetyllegionaminate synthase
MTMAIEQFQIGSHNIGHGKRCFVIGEVAQAHDGSLGMAHAFIDSIAASGADAVKFQTHIADAESSPQEPWRIRFSPQDSSRFAYWKRMEFTEDQWIGLKKHADDKKLVFLSSPFSSEAVDLLERIGIEAWKIASGEISNPLLLERIAKTRKPVLLSTGMSSMAEIDRAVNWLTAQRCAIGVMQCSSQYPTPPERVGLNLIAEYRKRFGCPVGLSDHSGNIFAGLAAVTLGADILEVHVTMSKEMFGPDVPVSLVSSELAQLVRGARFIEVARSSHVDKDAVVADFLDLRRTFTKSLFAREHIPAGTRIERKHLIAKKPGTGIPAADIEHILGRRVIEEVRVGQMVDLGNLEPAGGPR